MTKEQDISKLSFEEALAELEKIVRQLDAGGTDLKSSIDSYARGIELRKHCDAKLKEALSTIEKITVSEGGKVSKEALDLSE